MVMREMGPKVQGTCPSCHRDSLFLGSGGYVTCSIIGCQEPGLASDVLARGAAQHVLVRGGGDSRWSLRDEPHIDLVIGDMLDRHSRRTGGIGQVCEIQSVIVVRRHHDIPFVEAS